MFPGPRNRALGRLRQLRGFVARVTGVALRLGPGLGICTYRLLAAAGQATKALRVGQPAADGQGARSDAPYSVGQTIDGDVAQLQAATR